MLRHDALRTSFYRSPKDQPYYQLIDDSSEITTRGVIVDYHPDATTDAIIHQSLQLVRRSVTRLDEIDSAAKFAIVSNSQGTIAFAFSASHAVVDASSLVIMTNELTLLINNIIAESITDPWKVLQITFDGQKVSTEDIVLLTKQSFSRTSFQID